MRYSFDFRPYRRRFRQPIQSFHGSWKHRQGIIVRLMNGVGDIGWGEIAPLPWFGSETFPEALAVCRQLGNEVTVETLNSIEEKFPACQFAFESALMDLSHTKTHFQQGFSQSQRQGNLGQFWAEESNSSYCYLLPTGEAVIEEWEKVWEKGGKTFKWKIGVSSMKEEVRICQQLIEALPSQAKLRLDANGGLNVEEAKVWLSLADEAGIVEFIEQPLSPQHLNEMIRLSEEYSTAIALDESVSNLRQLKACYEQGWRGIVVIKAAIAGSPKRLRQFCQKHSLDLVFSSVFETAIGRDAVTQLAKELCSNDRALGFGVNHYFEEESEDWLEHLWHEF
ncbi:MAG: o-succinylbenzoate synthase [Chroococcales cyanobacterium]